MARNQLFHQYQKRNGAKLRIAENVGNSKQVRKWFDRVHHDKILKWIGYSKVDGGWTDYDLIQHNRSKRKKEKQKCKKLV